MFDDFVHFVRDLFGTDGFIPLHAPKFSGNEKKYLLETIDSTFVSSVGEFVNEFERKVAEYTGIKYTIATVNGTAALHVALQLSGVERDTEVITQSLTFVATCNAIRYCGAIPVFIDVDLSTLGLSPQSLEVFLDENCELRDDGFCWNKSTNRRVKACLPMHTFGLPVQLDEVKKICDRYNIELVEDAAESLGSLYQGRHIGRTGKLSALSFNGNKIITTGGGGMVLTNDEELAIRVKHITTTAKVPHRWAFEHDEVGFNYRLPNLNAALGVAQMETLSNYVESKRNLAEKYQEWGNEHGLQFVKEPANTRANYWLNAAVTQDGEQRDLMLEITNNSNVMTRPTWTPMHKLEINQDCQKCNMENTEWLFERLVNVPSSVVSHE
ncbi:MAG: LegC family aminotransferase [Candidatus Marinimicrobia bacterium]|jgi:perosamine synthetase|nr:LegC family aminotransferase [Candidatus Neomarinimicrobiota bacterium]